MKISLRDRIIALKRIAGDLAKDTAGNTLVIIAAAIIPLAALVGSGIDLSRGYMAQARLQMACDAAALAGRRAMTSGSVDSTVRSEALKFFRFNFETGETGRPTAFNVASFTPTVDNGANSAVVISASTTIPTTLMSMFGYANLPISVTCNAKQDFVNTDVMLVLDTTGSMLDSLNGTPKITSLRVAVLALYAQLSSAQTQLTSVGLRLRYGIVPYSSSVNTGGIIREIDPDYINDSNRYQSRAANYATEIHVGTAGSPNTYWEYYRSSASPYVTTTASQATTGITQANCQLFMNNTTFTGFPTATQPTSGGPAPTATVATTFPSDGAATAGGTSGEWGWSGAPITSGTTRSCRRLRTDITTTYVTRYSFTNWTYRQVGFDTSGYKTGNPVTVAADTNGTVAVSKEYNIAELPAATGTTSTTGLRNNGSTVTVPALTTTTMTWNGCIEERDTDPSISSSSGLSPPSGAYDLRFDLLPSSQETRWKPQWADISYLRSSTPSSSGTAQKGRGGSDAYVACPSPAKRLQAWTLLEMTTYLTNLVAIGGTYHDIGMIWGARLLSREDIFAVDNPPQYKNMPTSRYLVFLTDGAMAPNSDSYSSYGIELLDQRVTASSSASGQLSDHQQRFKMACQAVKSMEVKVWVIGFAQALDSTLTGCATDTTMAKTFTTEAALKSYFEQIGKDIGALRLTK